MDDEMTRCVFAKKVADNYAFQQANRMNIFKELSNGLSIQARATNRYWLILIIVSIISIVNLNASKTEEMPLPFNLGNVNYENFSLIILLMLCASAIAYASAFLQTLITRKLIHKVIDSTPDSDKIVTGVHIKDVFDSIVTHTFNRVAPISEYLQIREQSLDKSVHIKYLCVITHFISKLISMFITFFIPIYALVMTFKRFVAIENQILLGLPVLVYRIVFWVSIIVFSILIASDILYTAKYFKRVWKK